jgi:hypothetical protein
MARRRIWAIGTVAVIAALVVPSAASAAVTCDVQSGGNLDIRVTASNELGQIERSGGNIAVRDLFGPVTCLDFGGDPVTPTIAGTPAIGISSEPGVANTTFIVDDAPGFASAATFVNLRSGASSLLSIRAGDFVSVMTFGTAGVNTDTGSNEDLDITANNVPEIDGRGNFSVPVNFSAQGGGATGAALTAPIEFLGSSAADVLLGGEGGDLLQAFGDNDAISGNGGDDRIRPSAGNDSVNGGPGTDTVDYSDLTAGVSVDLSIVGTQNTGGGNNDSLTGIENVTATFLVDVLRGNGGPNRFEAGNGVDILEGRDGDDTILASGGDDQIDARDGGPDTVDCGLGIDSVKADRQGVDTLSGCELVEFASTPVDPVGQPGPPPPPPLPRPALTALRLTPPSFATGRRTTVSFRLDTAASVTFRVARRLSEPRRFALLPGRFTRDAQAGLNRFSYGGRLRGKVLAPGAYRLEATPRAVGSQGATARRAFRVLPEP